MGCSCCQGAEITARSRFCACLSFLQEVSTCSCAGFLEGWSTYICCSTGSVEISAPMLQAPLPSLLLPHWCPHSCFPTLLVLTAVKSFAFLEYVFPEVPPFKADRLSCVLQWVCLDGWHGPALGLFSQKPVLPPSAASQLFQIYIQHISVFTFFFSEIILIVMP